MSATVDQAIVLSEPQPLQQGNPAAVYLAGLEPTGRRTQLLALKTIAQKLGAPDAFSLNWAGLRYHDTAMIRAWLAEAYSPATANKMLSALRQVLKQAWLLGQMSADDYRLAVELKPVTGETIPAGRELSGGEILALMEACQKDPGPAGTRDAAMIGLLYGCGLRRDEVVKLDLSDFDPDTGLLTLTGKRNKQRTAYLTNGALEAMCDWLDIRGTDPGALFVAINRGGRLDTSKPMSSQAIYNLLAKRGSEAHVKQFSPHDLRRTFVSDLLDKGADIATVAKMAGHANVQTTARYDRRPEEAKRKAASLLHVPYKPKGG
jgi:site-specific recombinase XerD